MKHYVHLSINLVYMAMPDFLLLKLVLTSKFDLYHTLFDMLVNNLKPYKCIAYSLSDTLYISFYMFSFH